MYKFLLITILLPIMAFADESLIIHTETANDPSLLIVCDEGSSAVNGLSRFISANTGHRDVISGVFTRGMSAVDYELNDNGAVTIKINLINPGETPASENNDNLVEFVIMKSSTCSLGKI